MCWLPVMVYEDIKTHWEVMYTVQYAEFVEAG